MENVLLCACLYNLKSHQSCDLQHTYNVVLSVLLCVKGCSKELNAKKINSFNLCFSAFRKTWLKKTQKAYFLIFILKLLDFCSWLQMLQFVNQLFPDIVKSITWSRQPPVPRYLTFHSCHPRTLALCGDGHPGKWPLTALVMCTKVKVHIQWRCAFTHVR